LINKNFYFNLTLLIGIAVAPVLIHNNLSPAVLSMLNLILGHLFSEYGRIINRLDTEHNRTGGWYLSPALVPLIPFIILSNAILVLVSPLSKINYWLEQSLPVFVNLPFSTHKQRSNQPAPQ